MDCICLESPPHNNEWHLVINIDYPLAENVMRNKILIQPRRFGFSEYFLQGLDSKT